MAAEASASSQMIEAGHAVGPYTLTREIGKGSFAVVFQGKADIRSSNSSYVEDGSHGAATPASLRPARVAIKIVTRKKLTAKLLENLEGEISILRTVRHANIVELIDCLKTSSHIYLIMEYCRMGDLSNFIKTRARSSLEKASGSSKAKSTLEQPDAYLDEMDTRYPHPADGGLNNAFTRSFLAQLAGALQFMRARNIVHRDIKPQNLLLQEPEAAMVSSGHPKYIPQVKVADFGFARHLEAASLAETLCGSPLYMAPEILRYEKYDAKADLWSVGAVLFEMCIGKPPFRAANHVELLRKIERGEDRIKFPDERSDESLRREHYKRVEEGRAEASDFVRPHDVPADLKDLIRALLKRRPVERMGFEQFFLCDPLREYQETMRRAIPPESLPTPTAKSRTVAHVHESMHGQPIATRPAPAVPANTEPLRDDSRRASQASASLSSAPQTPGPVKQGPVTPSSGSRAYFAPRYVVGALDSATSPSPSPKNAGPKSEQKRPKAQSARYSSIPGEDLGDGEASSLEENALETPGSSVTHLPGTAGKSIDRPPNPGSKSGSLYEDERGYVMVDKKSIDANVITAEDSKKAKAANAGGVWSPLGVVRRPSQLGRLASLGAFSTATAGAMNALVSMPSPSQFGKAASPSPTSPLPAKITTTIPTTPSKPINVSPPKQMSGITSTTPPLSLKLSSTPPNAPFALPRSARRPSYHSRTSQTSDSSRATPPSLRQQVVPASAPTAGRDILGGHVSNVSSSQPPNPSSALARAISMASIRLFGVPASMSIRNSNSRRPTRFGLMSSSPIQGNELVFAGSASSSHLSYSEQNLLHHLHDHGQKSFVLSEFADAKLAMYFADGPHQNNHTDHDRKTSAGSHTSANGSDAPASATAANESPSLSSTPSTPSLNQIAASEALVLYVRSLSFLQRAIDIVREYIEVHSISASRYAYNGPGAAGGTTSTSSTTFQPVLEVAETVQWLHAKFNDGLERANFARNKAADELPETAQHVEKMIFDKAIEIARTAALDELAHQSPGSKVKDTHSISATSPIGADEGSGAIPANTPAGSKSSEQLGGAGWNAEHCLLAYETASSMLMGLLDPPTGNTSADNDIVNLSPEAIKTVERYARSINKRIANLQQR